MHIGLRSQLYIVYKYALVQEENAYCHINII